MPLYRYVCSECGASFEVLRFSHSENLPSCESCGSSEVIKQLSKPAPPVMKENPKSCCGRVGGCENPRRCCEKE